MTPRTLPREPWRGSMICGWQNGFRLEYCAERKADGLPMCQAHYDDCMDEYGEVRMAPGNAVGESHWAIRLLWEPMEGEEPIEASAEEVAAYAAILTPERGE